LVNEMKMKIFSKRVVRLTFRVLFLALLLFTFFAIKVSEVKADPCPAGWYCYGSVYLELKAGCKTLRSATGQLYCQQDYIPYKWYGCNLSTCGGNWVENVCTNSGSPPPLQNTIRSYNQGLLRADNRGDAAAATTFL